MLSFEVEIKFQVYDVVKLEQQLRELANGDVFGEPVIESDSFYQHPSRDFTQTDECLRIRAYPQFIWTL